MFVFTSPIISSAQLNNPSAFSNCFNQKTAKYAIGQNNSSIFFIHYIIVVAAKDTKSDQASLDVAGIDCFVEFESVLKPKGSFLMVTKKVKDKVNKQML